MDPKFLRDLAAKWRDTREYITNEEMTKQALIVPFISALGYDPTNPREVRAEYTAEFTAHDGKRLPDRMDYAIFDSGGKNILLVIEAKPLGWDVHVRSPQLSRYMSQLPLLRFGIITDGCQYLFFSDLNSPNVMDAAPFFSFSLADPKLDFESVARFLAKFSREQFNAERLIQEAGDSVYRQQMVEKLVGILKAPQKDEAFLRWLTTDIYTGNRSAKVMERMGRIAAEAIQPAVLRTLGDDFVSSLRIKINEATTDTRPAEPTPTAHPVASPPDDVVGKAVAVTTEDELAFFGRVREQLVKGGEVSDHLIARDTTNYFNVSYRSPTRWFLRYFGETKRKAIVTLVPLAEAQALSAGFEIEAAPATFGVSRIYLDNIEQISQLSALVARSLEICKAGHVQAVEGVVSLARKRQRVRPASPPSTSHSSLPSASRARASAQTAAPPEPGAGGAIGRPRVDRPDRDLDTRIASSIGTPACRFSCR